AVISAALVGAARANFLFPKPVFNPSTQAQLPHVVPPSSAPNRPLFLVRSASVGPYRVGDLDVYDGSAWRFAPIADSQLATVPRSGVVVTGVPTGVTAQITIQGYTGTVLPSLYGLTGIVATGPTLAYDSRSNTIQVSQGEIAKGFQYTIAAAGLPSIAALRADVLPLPPDIRQFLAAPPVPPQIANLLTQLRASNSWDTFVALRKYVLDTVTANGPGIPAPVPPTRVVELLFGSKEGSPYEATAAIALLARWAGIPSRIGFGFQADPTAKQGDAFVIRPRDAISYPEVYFPVYGWLPVTGLPQHAAANDTNTHSNRNPNVLPSTSFGVQLALPILTPPPSRVASIILDIVGLLLVLVLIGGIGYVAEPALAKAWTRSRRRAAARAAGPRTRVALAYAEWRDAATDFGYRHDADTPLAFLARFAPDEEHRELAWLVTRSVWGDLRTGVGTGVAEQAEELSRALRARLAAAHPVTLRLLSSLSRLSLRHPYAPDLYAELASKRKEGSGVPAPTTQPV
ncbi:MAG: transglutaminase-like domain-containing protein, partial [Mycobacteriales bacterium]